MEAELVDMAIDSGDTAALGAVGGAALGYMVSDQKIGGALIGGAAGVVAAGEGGDVLLQAVDR